MVRMLAINRAGVIFPLNEQIDIYEEKKIKHEISERNSNDIFYTFGVIVPKYRENMNYSEFKKELDLSIQKTIIKIRDYLT